MRAFVPSFRVWQVLAAVRERELGHGEFDLLEWLRGRVSAWFRGL